MKETDPDYFWILKRTPQMLKKKPTQKPSHIILKVQAPEHWVVFAEFLLYDFIRGIFKKIWTSKQFSIYSTCPVTVNILR